MPERIQFRRLKGWRKPAMTILACRPTKWGNPWVAEQHAGAWRCRDTRNDLCVAAASEEEARDLVIAHYRAWAEPHAEVIREDLRGYHLACFCRLDQPCHADVLLEIANG